MIGNLNVLSTRLKTKILLTVGIFSLMLSNFACQGGMRGAMTGRNFLDMDTANEVAEQVRKQFGDTVRVLEIRLKSNDFEVQIQDPNNPKNVDRYKYQAGTLVKDGAVTYSRMENYLKYALFDFSLVSFSAIPRLANEIRSQAEFKGGKIREIIIKRRFDMEKEFEAGRDLIWAIDYEYDGQSVRAEADGNEKIIDLNLSKTNRAASFNLYKEKELKIAEERIRQKLGEDAQIIEIRINRQFLTVVTKSGGSEKNKGYWYDINGLVRRDDVNFILDDRPSFRLKEINLTAAARLAEIAVEKFPSPEANVQSIDITKLNMAKGEDRQDYRLVWQCNIFPTLKKYVLFDAEGNLIRVEK